MDTRTGVIRSLHLNEELKQHEVELEALVAERLLALPQEDRVSAYEGIEGKAARKAAKRKRARARKAKR
jgi:hypothetical protein